MSGTLSAASLAPVIQAVTGVAGAGSAAYNIYDQYKNQQYQNLLRSYAQDPAKMNAYAAQFTQPLNAGLTKAVGNQSQAYLAERGLSDSPEISQQVEAQAIAPYIQQNQQAGYQDALQALNLGGGAIPPGQSQQNNISALAKAFSQLPGGSNPMAALMRLVQQGNQQASSIPVAPPPDFSIPNQPTQNFDFSSWTPDYSGYSAPETDAGTAD